MLTAEIGAKIKYYRKKRGLKIAELAELLQAQVVYRRDGSYTEYDGQAVTFTLELTGGATRQVTAYNPFLIIDGVGYRCKYEPCEALNRYANRLLRDAS